MGKREALELVGSLEARIQKKQGEIRNKRWQRRRWMGFLVMCQSYCKVIRKKMDSEMYVECAECGMDFVIDSSRINQVEGGRSTIDCPHCGKNHEILARAVMNEEEKGGGEDESD